MAYLGELSKVGNHLGELLHIVFPIFAFTSVSKYECMTDSPLSLLTPRICVIFSLENKLDLSFI